MNFKEWLNIQEATAFGQGQQTGRGRGSQYANILRLQTVAPGGTADFSKAQSPLDPRELGKRAYAGTVGAVGSAWNKALYSDPAARPTPVSQFFGNKGVTDGGNHFLATATVPKANIPGYTNGEKPAEDKKAIDNLKDQMMKDPQIVELIESGQVDPRFASVQQTGDLGESVTIQLKLPKASPGGSSQIISRGAQGSEPEPEATAFGQEA